MSNSASFKVYYSGSALDTGKMDVRELAPALLAVGSLLEEANRVLNGNKATVSVKVKRFEDGSFGIDFELAQTVLSLVVDMFSGERAAAAANILTYLGFSSGVSWGLIKLIKQTKGKKPDRAKVYQDGKVELDFSGEKYMVDEGVFNLYRDLRVRKEIENTLRPLENEGIEEFIIRENTDTVESINKTEAPYYQSPEAEDEVIQERETIATYSIHTLSFKEDNKWRLTDGTSTFFVTIKDEDFLYKVKNNLVSFSRGDLLELKLHVTSWNTKDGLKTEYEAIKVLNHQHAAVQLKLDYEQ